MYGSTNRLGDTPRHEQPDLGLSPRDELTLATQFKTQLRQLATGGNVDGLWREPDFSHRFIHERY